VLSLAVLATIGVLLFEEAYDTETANDTTGYLIKSAVGVLLILFGLKKVIGKMRSPGPKDPPGWITALSDASQLRSFGVAVLNAVNPKVVILIAAAVNAIVQTGVTGGDLVVATLVLVLVASAPVVTALVYYLVGGESARSALDRARGFLVANTDIIVAVVLLLIGASVLGDGLSGFGD
jgi:threonine/homoserine/homoserine lactone efflux protein